VKRLSTDKRYSLSFLEEIKDVFFYVEIRCSDVPRSSDSVVQYHQDAWKKYFGINV